MDELISKRAVIEAIEKARANVGHNLERSIGKSIIEILDDVGRDVDRLPSAHGTNLASLGTDCISRQAAIDAVYKNDRCTTIKQRLDILPPIQPEPKRGKWIRTGSGSLYDHYECSECGKAPKWECMGDNRWKIAFTGFCPNCGADMREVTT